MGRYHSGSCAWCKAKSDKLEFCKHKNLPGQPVESLCITCYAILNNATLIELLRSIDAGMRRAEGLEPDPDAE